MTSNHESSPGTARLQPGESFQDANSVMQGKWHSRGYMPHFDSPRVVQHVTFRLADSLPERILLQIEQELQAIPAERQNDEKRIRIESFLDAGHGSCLFKNPEAAALMQNALLSFDGCRYRLFAWTVMPNHVHVLFQAMEGWTMARIVASWKSYTGRRLMPSMRSAQKTNDVERVWYREYWDRFIRDERHFQAARAYIHNNPVKAGLAKRPENWEWSSAWKGRKRRG